MEMAKKVFMKYTSSSSFLFPAERQVAISYGIDTTKYWLRAVFKENKLASSPLILHKTNILWY